MKLIIFLALLEIIGPFIGWGIWKLFHIGKKEPKIKDAEIKIEPHDSPMSSGGDFARRKSLGQVLDNRSTNIFRPFGGLFGDD